MSVRDVTENMRAGYTKHMKSVNKESIFVGNLSLLIENLEKSKAMVASGRLEL